MLVPSLVRSLLQMSQPRGPVAYNVLAMHAGGGKLLRTDGHGSGSTGCYRHPGYLRRPDPWAEAAVGVSKLRKRRILSSGDDWSCKERLTRT